MPQPSAEITGRREPQWAGALAMHMRAGSPDHPPKVRAYVRPSDAMNCARRLGYVFSGTEGAPMDDSGVVNVNTGEFLHKEWQKGMAFLFEALRYLWQVEHGDELPEPGVPWLVEIEMKFKTSIQLPDGGPLVPIDGYADCAIFDAWGNLLEVIDAKSQGGYAYKKVFDEGVGSGPWLQTWSYARAWVQNTFAAGATVTIEPAVTVMNLAKDHISVGQASRYKASQTERWANEHSFPVSHFDAAGFAEFKRMWGINQLVNVKGELPKRTIPEYGSGTEILAPGTKMFDDGTTGWQCDYCPFTEQCTKDGRGRVPIPESSLLAISRREGVDKLAEAFPGAVEAP